MTLLEHLNEFRLRVIRSAAAFLGGTIIGYILIPGVLPLLFAPLSSNPEGEPLYQMTLPEGFLTRLQLSFTMGLLFASPFILYQILKFIMPALSRKEKKIVGMILPAGLLTAGGAAFYAYHILLPISVTFLQSQAFIPESVLPLLSYTKTVSFVTGFLSGAVMVFQIPLLIFALLAFKVISYRQFIKAFRPVIVAVFFLSAILTPPDVVSQIGVALPIIAIMFLFLVIGKIFKLGKTEEHK